jgi:hypothetical protein
MKEFIAKYQKAIVGTGAIAVLVVCYFQQKELSKLRAEQKIEVVVGGDIEKANIIDSLHDELFIIHTQNGRYELTFEHLKEVNPKLGKEMEDWMNHETE